MPIANEHHKNTWCRVLENSTKQFKVKFRTYRYYPCGGCIYNPLTLRPRMIIDGGGEAP